MSRENVELLHQAIDAFNRRDIDAFLALMGSDVEFTPLVVAMEGRYRGHDGIRRWWQDLFGVFPNWSVEVTGVLDRADLTLAALQARGRGGESGTPVGQTMWQLAEWVNGKGVRFIHYASKAEALEAAGLRE
jgi:ketosteroid isomerase-like protein